MEYKKYLKINFLDTSALVPLLLYPDILEKGSEKLAQYYHDDFLFNTLDLCVGEAFNVIKQKYFIKKRKQLSFDGYRIVIDRLIAKINKVKGGHLEVCSFDLSFNNKLLDYACKIVKKYETDFVDACVISYVKNSFVIDSQLITGDKILYKIALSEGIKSINFRKEIY